MTRVIKKHQRESHLIDAGLIPEQLERAAIQVWDDALTVGQMWGFRNAQATVLAPTGTISFMLDCDTTGIEPDLSLVKNKKLVGGGNLVMVNQIVGRALNRLGYRDPEATEILEYIHRKNTVEGAPHLNPSHYSVFDCAIGDRSISYMGHVKMMAAVQPFISGAISKTCNLPAEATVEDVERLFIEAWNLGLKAVAIYRDGCKVSAPMSASKSEPDVETPGHPVRRRLPTSRPGKTISFGVGDVEGYIIAGEYPGDGLGEIFLKVAKQGSTLSGIMDAFAIAVSIGLQYGVPLEVFASKFVNMKFEPAGLTKDDPNIRASSSLVDYVFRRLAFEYLPKERREALGVFTREERSEQAQGLNMAMIDLPPASGSWIENTPSGVRKESDAPFCFSCGSAMQTAGSCYVCSVCGSTSGCS
jgi:ribonucleoside-diphosphate reductase alpha chain